MLPLHQEKCLPRLLALFYQVISWLICPVSREVGKELDDIKVQPGKNRCVSKNLKIPGQTALALVNVFIGFRSQGHREILSGS